jgi:hypothetical protein
MYMCTYLGTYIHRYMCKWAFLTYSMEQIPSWEANRFVASQEILSVLLNPKVHYRIHKCPPPFSIPSQPNPVHNPTSHLLKIYPNIILPSTPGSPPWPLSLRFLHQNPIYVSPSHPRYIPHTSHSFRFYHPHNIGWGTQIMKLLIIKFSSVPCYLVPLRPKYFPQHPILKHPQRMLLPQFQRPSFTPIQSNRQNYNSVYLNL